MTYSSDKNRVFVFLDSMPQRQSSGAELRYYSNIRAYIDLGYQVEVIQVTTRADNLEPSGDLKPVTWTRPIANTKVPSYIGSAAYRLGIPLQAGVQYAFPVHYRVLREAKYRRNEFPGAIFHFDGETQANVIPWLPRGTRSVWSLHDLPSLTTESVTKIACEAEDRKPRVPELREMRMMQRTERLMARRSSLILCIGNHDALRIRNQWHCKQAHYFPMSIPGDGSDRRELRGKGSEGLRLLHVGAVSHLPSYRSLEFIFEHIFPLLPRDMFDRISLDVVGRLTQNNRSERILELASRYKNVSFRGFVEDLTPYYEASDLQIVASTDALGLRTRIIESLAFGLPVISTTVGAQGIGGFIPGEHLLIADSAEDFVERLTALMRSRDTLSELSKNGRAFYLQHHSSTAVAKTLSELLATYFPH